MHLLSKIKLKYNSGITGTKESIVIGKIPDWVRTGECDLMAVNYIYSDFETEGEAKRTILNGAFEIDAAKLKAIFDMIKNDIPVLPEDEINYEKWKLYLGFRHQMVQTFLPLNPNLTINDIDIVV